MKFPFIRPVFNKRLRRFTSPNGEYTSVTQNIVDIHLLGRERAFKTKYFIRRDNFTITKRQNVSLVETEGI